MEVLEKWKIESSLILAIQSFYKCCKNYIRTSNIQSGEFYTSVGVRQGSILSPLLFLILTDNIIKKCKNKMKLFCLRNWLMKPVIISELIFADDVLLAKTEEDLQQFKLLE
jgi:hypothetical protein